MNEQAVFASDFQGDLTDSLNKWLGFDITDRTADLGDDHISFRFLTNGIHECLDLICDMRDHLNSGPKVFAPAFFVQHVPVHLSGGQVGILVQVFINEPLIMTKVQIGLGTIFRYIDFSMLIRTHGTRIHVDVRIQFLGSDF